MVSFMPVLLGLWAGGAKLPPHLEQLFPLEEMIVLEEREESLVGGIGWLSLVDDRFLILDNIQDLVLIFDLRGRYLGRLGNKGQGPGEYLSPSQAMAGPFDSLCVVDRGRAAILFYDRTGQHRFTLSRDLIKPSFPGQVHWAGSWFFGVNTIGGESCPTGSFSVGHLLQDGSVEEGLCFGGGNLLDQLVGNRGPIPRAGLSKEGLWVAREYDDQVHLVDLSGRILRSFAYPAANAIRWQEVKMCRTRDEVDTLMGEKTQICALFPFLSYLFMVKAYPSAWAKGSIMAVDLLTIQGRLLISSVKVGAGRPLALDDALLISEFQFPEDERAWPSSRKQFPEEFAMLEARNIDWRHLGNPILRLGRVDAEHIAGRCQKEQP
jgi:hypothetical protein